MVEVLDDGDGGGVDGTRDRLDWHFGNNGRVRFRKRRLSNE